MAGFPYRISERSGKQRQGSENLLCSGCRDWCGLVFSIAVLTKPDLMVLFPQVTLEEVGGGC